MLFEARSNTLVSCKEVVASKNENYDALGERHLPSWTCFVAASTLHDDERPHSKFCPALSWHSSKEALEPRPNDVAQMMRYFWA